MNNFIYLLLEFVILNY